MKDVLLMLIACSIFLFGLWGCTNQKFEASNIIYPTVLSADDDYNDIAIEYNLGKLLVLDELDDINEAEFAYILKHKENLHLTLKIAYDDGGG